MLPHEPPRNPSTGFLYFPPIRIQGYSIAGEETFVQVPEFDVCFDVGRAQRLALNSNFVALSHGHMDHAAGLAYYFSQRHFQGMGTGTVLCHPTLADPIRRLMDAWIDIEAQRTPYKVVALDPDGELGPSEFEVKNTIWLRCFATSHTVPALGFSIVEKRSKLKEEYVGLPQPKLVELKAAGEQITYLKEIPLVTYMGDTAPGSHFDRPEVTEAKVLITECTFLERAHRDRARIGRHLHLSDIVKLLPKLNNEAVVLTHMSRRTFIGDARAAIEDALDPEQRQRVHILMDAKTNRARYHQQVADAEAEAAAKNC